jgi:hypothetical protein
MGAFMETDQDIGGEDEGLGAPEFEVWNHLESGWQMAHDDMARTVGSGAMEFWEALASAVISLRLGLLLPGGALPVSDQLKKFFVRWTPETHQKLLKILAEHPEVISNPFLRHAIDLEVAGMSIGCANAGFRRIALLAPTLINQQIPDKAGAYLREVVHTFLMGFDPACIALCRGCFEQLCRACLLKGKCLTQGELRKPQTALGLLNHLKRAKLISHSADAAERLARRGNEIMHKGLYEEKILPQLSLASINDLVAVGIELDGKW